MKYDIILAGVGGQGILSIAAAIGWAALDSKLFIKQSEVHGMSQRGGAVQSNLRISSEEIASDLISFGSADLILSIEPMESLRYLPFLSDKGWLVSNSKPFVNINNYPPLEDIYSEIKKIKNHILIDAEKTAKEIGNYRASNIVMLGAASPFIDITYASLEKGIKTIFARKGEEVVSLNLRALEAGRKFAEDTR
ncbi:MAG TPA: indolepyruvate oxidoreductase subunit beta [Ignavibacteriaceae bacterium]|jgi:indolepyruvate ferredoxin oxidoreductase beta subunit|nr:indolepyruvate oxidoreductase subunit beta [Ignavibacteriaceae bacterium]HOJ17531.1 indolepyruvate oxidoreductase subunit beta [Ignavibacteriaceae bacterium]